MNNQIPPKNPKNTVITYRQGNEISKDIYIKVTSRQAQFYVPYKHKYLINELKDYIGHWHVRWNKFHKVWLVTLNRETKKHFYDWIQKWNFQPVINGLTRDQRTAQALTETHRALAAGGDQ